MSFPVIAIVAIVDVGIQWVMFVISAILKTEKFFDLIGGISFITCVSISFWMNDRYNYALCIVQYVCVCIWATRLGLFLMYRIWRDGRDRRFDDIKVNPIKLFITWNMQAVWVFLTLFPTLFLFEWGKLDGKDPFVGQYVGWAIWLLGWLCEVVADHQKLMFKEKPENAGKFINSGLWSISRHPNYLGEITLWWGLYISAVTVYSEWWWILVAAIGPAWVTFLLGVFSLRMLEKSGDDKYGQNEDYQEYKKKTKVLIPFII